jgi:hypothetical protein
MKIHYVLALLPLMACSATQQATVTTDANKAFTVVAEACKELAPLANIGMLIPQAAPVAVYGTAACNDAATVQKIAQDPTTLAWLNDLTTRLKALIPANLQTVPAVKPAAS